MSDIRAQSRREAEFDRLLRDSERPGDGCYYDDAGMQAAYEMGKRHGREECPAWHDAPTCAGIWVAQKEFAHTLHLSEGFEPLDAWKNYRWFGPIPTDEVKP